MCLLASDKKKISGSISQRYGSGDPDPDPQHCSTICDLQIFQATHFSICMVVVGQHICTCNVHL
jgi:hypothetical protein